MSLAGFWTILGLLVFLLVCAVFSKAAGRIIGGLILVFVCVALVALVMVIF